MRVEDSERFCSAAYVAGVLGTLIGADLSNLHAIPKLGAPVASIGGAGTLDGVFLSGIMAVLLARAFVYLWIPHFERFKIHPTLL